MRTQHKMLLLAALGMIAAGLVVATDAQAFVDPPILMPEHAIPGETVSVHLSYGECDGIIEWDGYPQITHTAGGVRLVVYMHHIPDIDWCVFPPLTRTIAIGEFPPGTYSVQVDRSYHDEINGFVTENLALLPFVIFGDQVPVPLSTDGAVSLGVLLLGLLLLAGIALRSNELADGFE